jgi:hypothetical protein
MGRISLFSIKILSGLTVRQHPTSNYFYAQGLRTIPVGSYTDIERRINEGTANRTIAATNMNTTSSRAHTVVTIYFDQIIQKDTQYETKKTSVINLIDLAGKKFLTSQLNENFPFQDLNDFRILNSLVID